MNITDNILRNKLEVCLSLMSMFVVIIQSIECLNVCLFFHFLILYLSNSQHFYKLQIMSGYQNKRYGNGGGGGGSQ